MKLFHGILVTLALVVLCSFDLPSGWFPAGSKPKHYSMGIDPGSGQNGSNAATIKSIDKSPDGFGTLMQESLPGDYLGKRVRMTGYMKTSDVSGWAALWLRVDQCNSTKSLSFDNMSDRPVKGTTTWMKYEIVLDVPKEASQLAYGALLDGTGQIWFDNIQFEIVDSSVPTTGRFGMSKPVEVPTTPVNLDFEK